MRRILIVGFLFLSLISVSAQIDDLIAVAIPAGTTYLSRYNLRIHQNGSYKGLRYVEISGQMDRTGGGSYEASFWHVSESTHDLRTVSAAIDRVQKRVFTPGELTYAQKPLSGTYPDHLYNFPEYRNFPVLPSAVLYRLEGAGIPPVGSSYEAHAYRLTDPDGDGEFVPVQIYVRYIYRGTGEYLNETVHFFDADFALRSDGRLTGFAVQGRNVVRIAVFPGDETRIFMNNTITEQYGLEDRRQLRIEGFGLTWIRSPNPVYENPTFLRGIAALPGTEKSNDSPKPSASSEPSEPSEPSESQKRAERVERIERAERAEEPNEPNESQEPVESNESQEAVEPDELQERIHSSGGDIALSSDSLGLKLSLPNIQFEPDSTDLLSGERGRIQTLAEILKQAPDRRFLIVGHTADVGRPQGQKELSEARASRIAELLAAEGIPPGTMRYEGRGGTEAIGDNATPEGRAQNRRVEVIILN